MKKFTLVFFTLALSFHSFSQLKPAQVKAFSNNPSGVLSCNNWLNTPSFGAAVNINDLDVPGNAITVEASINRTAPYSGGNLYAGDIVAKMQGPTDANYLLRPNSAEITTSNGYFITPAVCPIDLNKTYHVAMVYNGTVLKFYRNGFLMSQVNATGTLIQNNYDARIGFYAAQSFNTQFLGYINEVCIWNVARTQVQLQTYMNSSLPSPATQTGLQAYYTFDDLLNKQGNPAWNGSLNGGAAINATNPNCSFTADSCAFATPISTIINQYTPVVGFDPCKNILTVGDAASYHTGDTVLLIQMKGAVIDSTNTAAFGTITDYKNAGNYEFNYIKSISGNNIELLNTVTRNYDIPNGKVQLVRVPYYQNAIVTSTLTCQAWNGATGGVLVFNAADSLLLNANIDVSGKGFRGATNGNNLTNGTSCFQNGYSYSLASSFGAPKGEGIAVISDTKIKGRGALANGGGGGDDHNSGGAGGGNGKNGGKGGYQFENCGSAPFDNGGDSGKSLLYSNAQNKVFLGGGGGSGHANNIAGFNPDGGNGGGIVLISCNVIKNNSFNIFANGTDGASCTSNPGNNNCNEGMGGGGSGGGVLLKANTSVNNIPVLAKGGNGANVNFFEPSFPTNYRHGPGGGGSGGIIWINQPSMPATVLPNLAGGINGVNTFYGNNAWGATPGQNGQTFFNLSIPLDNIPFKKNIDSVRIKDSLTGCRMYDFKGLGYVNNFAVANWNWDFGDATTASSQNIPHTYSSTGTYSVKLVVTDVNGCKDSITTSVIVSSCGISNVINDYTPVLALDKCKNTLTVGDATNFNTGDTVLLIQMKGAVIDSTNTAAFGTVIDYKNSGNYEFNYVQSKSGNTILLKNALTRNYDLPNGKVQLIRVPYYQNAVIGSTLTCAPWNGSTGGVLVFNAADSVILNADINVQGKGFNGGVGFNNSLPSTSNCFQNEYIYPLGSIFSGNKGESIANVGNDKTGGKGHLVTGGGAGLDHNGGGGGGANAGGGGFGGYQLLECGNAPFDNRGIGGLGLPYSNANNKIFLGGGGGSGHANNPGTVPAGGNGGGMVIIGALRIKNNGHKIIASGDDAPICTVTPSVSCHDGMGGGGGGGSVLLNVNQVLNAVTVEEKGGKGADMTGAIAGGHIGAGGGGGGGVLWVSSITLPANISNINSGGLHGVLTTDGNSTWGATDGTAGSAALSLLVPVDVVPFKKNIDSVRFAFSGNGCSNNVNFSGMAYINGVPIIDWHWDFGDGNGANTQNTGHAYSATGTYTVKLIATDNNGCKDSISKDVVIANIVAFDFYYKQDICNPLSVQFTATGSALNNPYWSFGDNLTASATLNPVHNYVQGGNYLVRFTVDQAGGCNDTISKMISINMLQSDIIFTPDTTICFGASKQLRALPSGNFCWSPPYFLDNPNSPTPITSTPYSITYTYSSEVIGNNLIVNGDFNAGNSGFTSAYTYALNNTTEGEYFVGLNPAAWNPSTAACVDHTTGNGNMMLVNGAPLPGSNVWKETIAVNPNSNYNFACWAQSIFSASPAQLQFSINNLLIGPVFSPGAATCNWKRFFSTWNSGNNATATIAIVNLNTTVGGNDFALDDISFAPVTIKYDSVIITVDTPYAIANGGGIVCPGTPVQLGVTGGSVYTWSPIAGLSNPNIANPVATPASTTTYTVTGFDMHSCSLPPSTVTVTLLPRPAITKTPDTALCNNTASVQLFAAGGNTYSWSPAATLNNPAIANPIATPLLPVTKYYVVVTNTGINGCTSKDSIIVTRKPLPAFGVLPSKSTCQGTAVQLNATGGDVYLWSPATAVTNANISNPFTTTSATTFYRVTITESTCNISQTLATTVTINPTPVVSAIKSNDIDCSIDFAKLLADGAAQYIWTPSKGLSSYTIYNPIAKPDTTTQYIVKGFNSYGCSASDTLTVAVTMLGKSGYYMPNSFTPNGDGKNDCFGIKYWGIVQQLQFIIYNRWGEKVFASSDPNACWDGNYKSAKADGGSYVYYIKAITACGPVEKKGNVLLIR